MSPKSNGNVKDTEKEYRFSLRNISGVMIESTRACVNVWMFTRGKLPGSFLTPTLHAVKGVPSTSFSD